ncbi:MAG: tetratricopeptide repeat protein [Gammaproteobacteria bacterium]|nr:tetratricopeptide repeat protein [Gammaproteobacteria bacterium]
MIRTLVNSSVLLFVVVAAGTFTSSADAAEDDYLDSIKLLELLHARRYSALERRLSEVQKRYEDGLVSDSVVMLAFEALANSDPAHEPLFNEWVESMPDSYVPLAARGMYLVDVGWSRRGSAYSRDTSDEQFAGMREYHARGLSDLQEALRRNPRFIAGYAEIIGLTKTSRYSAMRKDTLKQALEIDPRSYVVRKAHLWGLMPRWGGSYEEINTFLDDTRKYVDQNPELNPLLGFADYVRAFNYGGRDKHQKAIEHYTKALEHGDKSWYYKARGVVYYRMDDNVNALKDLNKALELWPQYADALAWRGTIYEEMEKYDEALADLTLAGRLKPYGSLAQKHLGNVLAKKGRYEEAIKAYDAVLYYQPHRGHIWRKKAWYLTYKLNRPEEGVVAYKKAAERRSNRPVYWYDYGYVLHELEDCEMVPVLRTFVRACEYASDKRCNDQHKRWAKRVVNDALTQANCPDKAAYPIKHDKKRPARVHSTSKDMNAWEWYKLYVRGLIWLFLEWLGVPR